MLHNGGCGKGTAFLVCLVSDGEVLKKSVEKCLYLEHLILDENPLLEEIDNR